jgi:hypothetical protein
MTAVKSVSFNSVADIPAAFSWDLAFVGMDVDARGEKAISFARQRSKRVVHFSFSLDSEHFEADGQVIQAAQLQTLLTNAKSIALEATTLGVVEILRLLRALLAVGRNKLDVLYVEPIEYAKRNEAGVLFSRQFSLSGNRRFTGVKGFMIDLASVEKGHAVFFLGYEGERLFQAFEQLPLQSLMKTAVFGVPAYEAGWEMNAFANNVDKIAAEKFEGIKFCAGSSVMDAYRLLSETRAFNLDPDCPIVVIPIGTKPHSIATALFLCSHASFQESALIFDHPVKQASRSKEIRKWHVYQVARLGQN